MPTDTLSSQSIANLDAFPVVANTSGQGARATLMEVADNVTPTALGLQATASKYKMVRLPTYCKLLEVVVNADARPDTGTGLALDVGAYYSDSTVDGTPTALQGTAISVNALAAILAFNAAWTWVHADASLTNLAKTQPLWQALGLASDPGGFIDLVIAVHTAATTGVSTPIRLAAKVVV